MIRFNQARLLQHFADHSIYYKSFLAILGLSLVYMANSVRPGSGFLSFGVAILSGILANAFMRIFPADALDDNIKATGLTEVYRPPTKFGEDGWFELLKTSKQVDIGGRSLFRWINTTNKKKEFMKIIHDGVASGSVFRILLMSQDNCFLAALEEQGVPLHKSLVEKLEKVEAFFGKVKGSIRPAELQGSFIIRCNYALPFYRTFGRFDSVMLMTPYLDNRKASESYLVEIEGSRMPLFKLYAEEFDDMWKDKRNREIRGTKEDEKALVIENCTIREHQDQHYKATERIRSGSRYRFHDFGKGWELMFKQLKASPEDSKVLRDFTLASVGRSTFTGYNFETYASRTGLNARAHAFSVQAMIMLDTEEGDFEGQAKVRDYIKTFIRLIYPNSVSTDPCHLSALLSGEDSLFKFALVPRAEAKKIFRNPFNVYGDFALSESVIQDVDSSPYLEVCWEESRVAQHLEMFDELWGAYLHTQAEFFKLDAKDSLNKLF